MRPVCLAWTSKGGKGGPYPAGLNTFEEGAVAPALGSLVLEKEIKKHLQSLTLTDLSSGEDRTINKFSLMRTYEEK